MTATPSRALWIIKTGDTLPAQRARHGDFEDWIAGGLNQAPASTQLALQTLDARTATAWPQPGQIAGVVVTGSPAMVTDREPWSERTAAWLASVVAARVPVLGICYGHQLLAHTLGGEVDYNPQGREMGTVAVDLHPHAGEDPLFAPLPGRFEVQVSHLQSVLRPPADATVLARSDQDACQAFRWRDRAWGLQFHPEFSAAHMRGYVHARRDALQREGRCHRRMAKDVKPTPHARGLLRRFVRHAATLRGH